MRGSRLFPRLPIAGMPFKGVDIPLHMLSGEKFEQPILFGANNLSGIVQTNVAHAGPVGAYVIRACNA